MSKVNVFLISLIILVSFNFVYSLPSADLVFNKYVNKTIWRVNLTSTEDLNKSILEIENGTTYNISMLNTSLVYWGIDVNNLLEGEHNFTIYLQNTTGNWSTVNDTFIVDLTNPNLKLISPKNKSVINEEINLELFFSENVTNCTYLINSSSSWVDFNCDNITINNINEEGWYNISIHFVDLSGNNGFNSSTFYLNFKPSLNLLSPIENKIYDSDFFINLSVNDLNVNDSLVFYNLNGTLNKLENESNYFVKLINISSLENKTYNLTINVTDKGNLTTILNYTIFVGSYSGNGRCDLDVLGCNDSDCANKTCGIFNGKIKYCINNTCSFVDCYSDEDCALNDSCTLWSCKNPGELNSFCEYKKITNFKDNDGCCPVGANSSVDSDCDKCGDGICDPWENACSCRSDCNLKSGECCNNADCPGNMFCDISNGSVIGKCFNNNISCGNGKAEPWENCKNCPEDFNLTNKLCCDGNIISGECCNNSQCVFGFECINYSCVFSGFSRNITLIKNETKEFISYLSNEEKVILSKYVNISNVINLSDGNVNVLRYVSPIYDENKTLVSVFIKNKLNESLNVIIIEDINKSLESNLSMISFNPIPNEILRKDPIVLWELNLGPGEYANVSYIINKIVNNTHYFGPVYTFTSKQSKNEITGFFVNVPQESIFFIPLFIIPVLAFLIYFKILNKKVIIEEKEEDEKLIPQTTYGLEVYKK